MKKNWLITLHKIVSIVYHLYQFSYFSLHGSKNQEFCNIPSCSLYQSMDVFSRLEWINSPKYTFLPRNEIYPCLVSTIFVHLTPHISSQEEVERRESKAKEENNYQSGKNYNSYKREKRERASKGLHGGKNNPTTK